MGNHASIEELIMNDYHDEKTADNLFSILGIETKELLHSRFIAFLLAPNGKVYSGNSKDSCLNLSHNYGTEFLKAFLKRFLGAQYKSSLKKSGIELGNLNKAEVYIEYEDKKLEGRIDILIKINDYWMAIENKIHASDGENQLDRYYDYLKEETKGSFDLLYLTLDGHEASEFSTKELKNGKDYYAVSYSDYIKPLLKNIKKDGSLVAECIGQYKLAVDKLVNKFELGKKLHDEKKSVFKEIDKILKGQKDEQFVTYIQDLLKNYIYPEKIKTIINDLYKNKKNIWSEDNTIYIWVDETKKIEYDIFFDFNEINCTVSYYPIKIDRSDSKHFKWYWGRNPKNEDCSQKKDNWVSWKTRTDRESWNGNGEPLKVEDFLIKVKKKKIAPEIRSMKTFIKNNH